MSHLAGRTAIVTGGSSGIGRATALRLAEAGARVCVADRNPLAENQPEFDRLNIEQRVCDARSVSELGQLIDDFVATTGRLDILVNNAGIGMVKPVTDVSEEDWDACIDTNLKAAFFGSKHAIIHMQSGGGGCIVNTASNAGLLPRAHDPVYSISKQALVGLTRSLALCHASDKIRVNAVCPGPVGETAMMEDDLNQAPDRERAVEQLLKASPIACAAGRMISPDEVAQAVEYLVSDGAAMVTGTMVAIDGGKSLGVPPTAD